MSFKMNKAEFQFLIRKMKIRWMKIDIDILLRINFRNFIIKILN